MQKTALKFIWNYLKIFKFMLVLILALMSLSRLLEQGAQYYFAKLFEHIASAVGQADYWQVTFDCIVIITILALLGGFLRMLADWYSSRLIPHIRSIVIRDTFDYVNKQSISYFVGEMTGNISNKFHQLQNGVIDFFAQIHGFLHETLYTVITIGILTYLSWVLGLGMILWIALMVYQGFRFGRKRAKLSKQTSTLSSQTNAQIIDSIANYAEIKSFANYKFERLNILRSLRLWRKAETSEQKAKVKIRACMELSAIISIAIFIVINTVLLYWHQIDITTYIFALSTFDRLSWTSFSVNWAVNNFTRITGQMNSALDTLAVEPEIVDSLNAKTLKAKKAEVAFDKVGFSYNNNQNIFEKFNLNIKAGEKIGIVGSSGAGKSTLIKLIVRYFDVTDGSVTINGHDIREFTQDSLHKNIAVIPQDVCLFNRTIMDNIRYGNVAASDAEVIKAAKAASADKFIEELPSSYRTKVGDRGVILSGGERQRIAIARAILKNAPILIFDEATSSLDSESEKYIQNSMKTLMKNKTVVAIAHRLSTLREMDRIIVMEKGKIVEEGTHLSLLRKKGRYAKLFKMQSDGYLPS